MAEGDDHVGGELGAGFEEAQEVVGGEAGGRGAGGGLGAGGEGAAGEGGRLGEGLARADDAEDLLSAIGADLVDLHLALEQDPESIGVIALGKNRLPLAIGLQRGDGGELCQVAGG